jgi:hypothetical protein
LKRTNKKYEYYFMLMFHLTPIISYSSFLKSHYFLLLESNI